MVFQFTLPKPLKDIASEAPRLIESEKLFGESPYTEARIHLFQKTINQLLDQGKEFDVETLNQGIAENVPLGCRLQPPNVVILQPGPPPDCNDNVHKSCTMFYKDVRPVHGYIDAVADEAIFRRLIPYHESHSNFRPFLGQWHTNRNNDECSNRHFFWLWNIQLRRNPGCTVSG
jgi:hypothetical protein